VTNHQGSEMSLGSLDLEEAPQGNQRFRRGCFVVERDLGFGLGTERLFGTLVVHDERFCHHETGKWEQNRREADGSHEHLSAKTVTARIVTQRSSCDLFMSFSSCRRNYLLTPHHRDGLIEW